MDLQLHAKFLACLEREQLFREDLEYEQRDCWNAVLSGWVRPPPSSHSSALYVFYYTKNTFFLFYAVFLFILLLFFFSAVLLLQSIT